jgi:hypothetical protein
MGRSERALVVLAVLAGLLAACQAIIGLDKFKKDSNECDFKDCAVPNDVVVTPDSDTFGEASVANRWVKWRMPNPPDAEVDANIATYGSPFEAGAGDAGSLMVVRDEVTRLEWMKNPPNASMTFAEATALCASLGSDFRLPTRIELVSLWDYTASSTAAFDPAFSGSDGTYWTQSPTLPNRTAVWVMNFSAGGSIATRQLDGQASVRCVR